MSRINASMRMRLFRSGGKIYRIPSKSESFQLYKKKLFEVVNSNGYKYVLRIASNGASFIDVKIAPSDLAAIYTFGERAYKNGEVNCIGDSKVSQNSS